VPAGGPPCGHCGRRADAITESRRRRWTWLGQSAFRIATPGGRVIITDPWLTKNPLTPPEYRDPARLAKVDVLLVTHGHADHIADAPETQAFPRRPWQFSPSQGSRMSTDPEARSS
jgi:phosphoribosyl 1,2-cyclic phosphodiesterase